MKHIAIKFTKWFISSSAHALTLLEDEVYYWEHGKRRQTFAEQLQELLQQRPATTSAYDAKLGFLDSKKKVN